MTSSQSLALEPVSATGPIDAVINLAIDQQRLVGAVVLVQHRGRELYRRSAGWADREHRRPMRTDTLFRLASVSKPIVTTAAMVLAGRGVVDLDIPVTRWLPDFQPRLADGSAPDITLRQLLSHQSGLGYRFLESDASGPYAQAGVSDGMDASGITLAENLRRIATVPLQFAPGEGWFYSLGIDVAGGVLEAATGKRLDEIVRDTVTGPLGMADTDFHALTPARLATPYVNDEPAPHVVGEGEIVPPFPDVAGIIYSPERALDGSAFASGGAGMVGTADDLMRLLEVLRQGGAPILDHAWVAQMARNHTGERGPEDAPGWGFGLGFSVLRDPAATGTPEAAGSWRWGGAYGHSWFVDPARELSVVAFTNTLYEGMSGAFVTELRDAVYGALEGTL
ncbi:serine hydrolase domain-containing protein [Dyella terrae]|uniref:serine hydrolase domain-containing protein n=1 Tax=Dyella terrae TaxID=522259 RepID=UPI001EFD4023|nr:serine hydrolase domain-containing protein [Dyella terrae]ULU26409.1 serine hydrolase [Dyella terrae]